MTYEKNNNSIESPQRRFSYKRMKALRIWSFCCCFVGSVFLLQQKQQVASELITTTTTRNYKNAPQFEKERNNNVMTWDNKRRRLPSGAVHMNNKENSLPQGLITNVIRKQNQTRQDFVLPRAFTPWPSNLTLPCVKAEEDWISMRVHNSPAQDGFLYLKGFKTGSSTSSGINLRIARNVALRKGEFDMCKCRFDHGMARERFHARHKDTSFLWTIIREPAHRVVSAFFHFRVSRNNVEPTDENYKRYISDPQNVEDHYLKSLYPYDVFNRTIHNPIDVTNTIFNEYNFIGITERMDESAVAIMMLLNLKIGDILYLSSKKHGGYDDGGGMGCKLIQPSFMTPTIQEFFNSHEWNELVKYDLMLYKAAYKSLDLTIESLGKEKFNENLKKFKEALKYAEEKCLESTIFPCDHGYFHQHNATDCLWNDSGCGTTCLDEVASELGLW